MNLLMKNKMLRPMFEDFFLGLVYGEGSGGGVGDEAE